MSIDYSPYVPDVTFELIPIKHLVSNQKYQRRLSESQIIRAAQDFDVCQINAVKVSRRDGINYVFDGQHTIEIVAAVSGSRDTPVWCMVFDSLYYEAEAKIFAEQQKHSRPLVPYETFIAHLEAGDKTYQTINALVQSYGLELSPNNKRYGVICAIGTVVNIFEKHGYHVLDRTLRMCISTWEGEQYSLGANMLMGIARLIVTFDEQLSEEQFKERLGQVSVKQLTRTARERRPGSLGYAEAMLMFYNRRCKYRLSMRKLYNVNGTEDLDFDEADEEEDETI